MTLEGEHNIAHNSWEVMRSDLHFKQPLECGLEGRRKERARK